jgi:hypothetical protein
VWSEIRRLSLLEWSTRFSDTKNASLPDREQILSAPSATNWSFASVIESLLLHERESEL